MRCGMVTVNFMAYRCATGAATVWYMWDVGCGAPIFTRGMLDMHKKYISKHASCMFFVPLLYVRGMDTGKVYKSDEPGDRIPKCAKCVWQASKSTF